MKLKRPGEYVEAKGMSNQGVLRFIHMQPCDPGGFRRLGITSQSLVASCFEVCNFFLFLVHHRIAVDRLPLFVT